MTRKQKKHLARIIAAAVLLALVWFVLPLEGIWQLLAYCVPYFIVGWMSCGVLSARSCTVT